MSKTNPNQLQLLDVRHDPTDPDVANQGTEPAHVNRYAFPPADRAGVKGLAATALEAMQRRSEVLQETTGVSPTQADIMAGLADPISGSRKGITPEQINRAVEAKRAQTGRQPRTPKDLSKESFKVKRMGDEPPEHIRKEMGRR